MTTKPNNNPSWSAGTLCLTALLLLLAGGSLVWLAYTTLMTRAQVTTPEATVQVRSTDGNEVRVWLERPGAPLREMPATFTTTPGPVSVRVARHTPDGDWRQDTVTLTLQANRLHLVPIGAGPVRIVGKPAQPTHSESNRFGKTYYPIPGVVGWPEPSPGATTPPLLTVGEPDAPPADPTQIVLYADAGPTAADEKTQEDQAMSGVLLAHERLVVAINPYLEDLRYTVAVTYLEATRNWSHTTTLPARSVRVFPLGIGSGEVRIETRRAADGAWIGAATTPAPQPGRPLLFTPGGATLYGWLGSVAGPMPAAPTGVWWSWPADRPLRLRRSYDPVGWLLSTTGPEDKPVGLAVGGSAPLVALGAAPALQPRTDVTMRELTIPMPAGADTAPGGYHPEAVAAVATDATGALLGIVDGQVRDLLTGKSLQDPKSQRVVHMTASPHGLLLLTGTGQLATLDKGQMILGKRWLNPTVRLVPAEVKTPSVWAYSDVGFVLQPLAGGNGTVMSRSGADAAAGPLTALTPTAGGAMLMASGRHIERFAPREDMEGSWIIAPVLSLPESGHAIIGLLDHQGRLLFATEECVYELRGDVVLPLVVGIGGPLTSWRGGVLVCDQRSGRLFHLGGPAFGAATSTGGKP
ncbi:MAG: hypothetical protein WCJ97_09125 [Phycisphaerae bacterium]